MIGVNLEKYSNIYFDYCSCLNHIERLKALDPPIRANSTYSGTGAAFCVKITPEELLILLKDRSLKLKRELEEAGVVL